MSDITLDKSALREESHYPTLRGSCWWIATIMSIFQGIGTGIMVAQYFRSDDVAALVGMMAGAAGLWLWLTLAALANAVLDGIDLSWNHRAPSAPPGEAPTS